MRPMRIADIVLLFRKIAVGAAVTLVPLWPILKSNIPGSELAADGPVVRTDIESREPGKELGIGNLPVQA